ncbi:MAG: L,D-transpeptidase [bacterium]
MRNLGSNVSHGCIRLSVEDAEWIYQNCTPGMTVIIQ